VNLSNLDLTHALVVQRTCTGVFSNPRSMSVSFKSPADASCMLTSASKPATLSFNLWLYLLTRVVIVVAI
jgi:hypothetical protein